MVVKRDRRREEFSKEKLAGGIRAACQKRPVSPADIESMVERILERIADDFDSEVPSKDICQLVMDELRPLDQVSYVRYASVYRRFEDGGDFVQAVKKLAIKNDHSTIRLPGF